MFVSAHQGKTAVIVTAITALLLCGEEASAQRTMSSQELLTAHYIYPFSGRGDYGLDVTYGQYMLSSLWNIGISGIMYSREVADAGQDLGYAHLSLYGEWLYRIAATRSRSVNLYAGGGVFIGYEAYDPFRRLPSYIDTGLGSGAFLYGVHAKAEAEFFLAKKLAAVLSGWVPVNLSSPLSNLNAGVMAGIRLNL